MAKAVGQFTITDLNDINIAVTAPLNPSINQLWLDSSVVPNQLKRWDGTTWIVVNDVQVGGRNLIKRSDFGNIVISGVTGVAVLGEDYQNGLKATGGNNGRNNYIEFPDVLSGNGWYTVSFLARGTQGGTRGLSVIIGDSPSITDGRISNTSDEYTYHTYSYKVENYNSETNNSIKIAELDYAYYRIDNIKLEKGNIATDWTPAPEDVEEKITTLSASVDVLVGEVNLKASKTEVTNETKDLVASSIVEYYLSTSSTSPTGGSWSETAPPWVNGRFMWSRTKVTTKAGTVTHHPNANGTNITGASGATGATGRGISSTVIHYAVSSSGTVTPTSWVTNIPTVAPEQYLWTRTTINYDSGSPSVSYSVGQAGKSGTPGSPGAPGSPGSPGVDGRSLTSSALHYQKSTSGTTIPTGTWLTTIPTVAASEYLWTRTTFNYSSAPTTTYAYSVGKMGDTGRGITSITPEYYLSTSKTAQMNGSWSTTPPAFDKAKYLWTRSSIVWSNPTATTTTTPVLSTEWNTLADHEVRVQSAEQQITPTAIINTVSDKTDLNGDPMFAKTSQVKQTVDAWTATFSQIGGRNLLRKSKVSLSNNSYPTGTFYMVEPMEEDEAYTITVWGSLGANKERFALYLNGGSTRLTYLEKIKAGMYQATFKGVSGGVDDFVSVYPMPQSITSVSNITHVQLEKGSVGTDWSPAPEEFYEGIVKIDLDGIEVGVSNSTIKTLFQYDGMRIVDNTTGNDIAKFTADGGNIDELTVKMVRSPHVANKVGRTKNYYVYSVATGDGSGRDEFNRASSVQDALRSALDDAVVIENNAQININISGAINEDISINGISGHGRINILGAYGSTRVSGRLFVNNTTCPVYCEGVTFISVETSSGLIYANGLSNVHLNHIRIDGANNSVGVRARNGAIVRIEDSPVVNCTSAYFADYMSQIFAFDTYGQGNAIVAGARQMGKVGMYYRRPGGTTLSQIYDGGIVDDNAAQTLSSFSYTPPVWSTISKTFVANLESENASSGYVWRTGTWTQGAWDGQAHKGTADFGTRIKEFLEGSGGYQNISNVIIKARRNKSSGRSNPVSLKITSPTTLTLPAVTFGASSQANANAAIITAMHSGSLKLQSSTTSSSDYAGFDRIEITFSVQKKV